MIEQDKALRAKGWGLISLGFLIVIVGNGLVAYLVIYIWKQDSLVNSPGVSIAQLGFVLAGSLLSYRGGKLLSKARQERNKKNV